MIKPDKSKFLYKNDANLLFYADFYPQRPDQAENALDEKSVSEGYFVPLLLRNETPSAFDVIHDTLETSLDKLSSFASFIIKKQFKKEIQKKSNFQIPEKVYMKDANLMEWYSNLASTVVGLHDLAQLKIPIVR